MPVICLREAITVKYLIIKIARGEEIMPLYEYECDICRYRFEMKQGFDAETIDICPQCQGRSRRVLHSTPLLFKGSGFYITDSRKDKEKTTPKEKAMPKEKTTPKDKKETASKPEQKEK